MIQSLSALRHQPTTRAGRAASDAMPLYDEGTGQPAADLERKRPEDCALATRKGIVSMPRITFILIPGAGGSAWYWHLVAPKLRQRGHEAVPVSLPSADDGAGLPEYAGRRFARHRQS
jgi:hypothetical protein